MFIETDGSENTASIQRYTEAQRVSWRNECRPPMSLDGSVWSPMCADADNVGPA